MASAGALTVVSQLFRRWTDRQSELDWGISGPRLHVLTLLAHAGPQTMGALASTLHVTPRAVTRLVDGLETQGYATRTPHPTDRRSIRVACTPTGAKIVAEFLPNHFAKVNQLLQGISPERLRTFLEVTTESGDRIGEELWPKE